MTPWVVLAALFLTVRSLLGLYAVTLFLVLAPVVAVGDLTRMNWLTMVGIVALMIVMCIVASSRARLGMRGLYGETLMVDLRDRLERGAQIPDLPPGWHATCAVRSAHGESFSGDFFVSTLGVDGRSLQTVLVDVSGKGRRAGSRSLHLSGAFSGLLGSVAASRFLGAANMYLVRQRWEEGFASAIHLDVDLITGEYTLSRAGHPPAVVYRAGTGTWQVDHESFGPLLGVLPDPPFHSSRGQLHPGDALMLYSDGVIESPQHELIDGLDRMLGVASAALVAGSTTAAEEVVDSARSGLADDRAAFVIRRLGPNGG